MTTEGNKAFVRSYLEEVFNRRNLSVLDQFANEQFKGGVVELVEKLHRALSGFHITVEDVIVKDDMVVTQETMQGLHTGEYLSPTWGIIRPTDKHVTWTRVAIRRIQNGKFARGFYGVALRGEGAELALLEHLNSIRPLRPEESICVAVEEEANLGEGPAFT